MKEGLTKTSTKLSEGINKIFANHRLDEEILQELEDLLVSSDMGVKTSREIISGFAREKFDDNISATEIKHKLAGLIEQKLKPFALPVEIPASMKGDEMPFIIMVVGVNGNGKTTTVGKMARLLQENKYKVMIAACDTFRAAAIDQLRVWSERVPCKFFADKEGSDPASVAYKAVEAARKEGCDILLIDTAGRLQSKTDLMQELQKISKVIKKLSPAAPHSNILVLDATTGQNAHSQVEIFKEMVGITGLVVTKLDGTAKGGVVVALTDRYKIPCHAIGLGEQIDDLKEFNASDFAKALVGI